MAAAMSRFSDGFVGAVVCGFQLAGRLVTDNGPMVESAVGKRPKASMQIVKPDPRPRAVSFGSRATIRRAAVMSDVTIVGEDEADPPTGLIAWTAPLARALEGAEPGDVVELHAGGRLQSITVVAVVAGD
jgi:hypothetical protein